MPLSILTFPGSASVPGMPKLDVSEEELQVANIPSLKFWPSLFEYGVKDGVVKDRVTRNVLPAYGVSQPATKFTAMINGKRGYTIGALADTLIMPGFDTSGSFTIACVCGLNLTFGSFAETAATDSVPAPWGIYSDVSPTGLVTMVFGTIAVASSVAANWPAKLSADKLTAVVLIFDRDAGTLTVRYNGVQMYVLTNALIKTVSLHKELLMGGMRTAGTGRAIATRAMTTNAFMAFNSALKGDELSSVENTLLMAAAAPAT